MCDGADERVVVDGVVGRDDDVADESAREANHA